MSNAEKKEKKSPVRLIVIGLLIIVGGYFGYKKIHFEMTHESTDNAQIETQITPVLPRVSGYVKTITVKDYDSVKAGELIATLDDADLQNQLAEANADLIQAQADVINARAALNNSRVSLSVNKGTIDINQVRVQKAADDLKRDQNLFNEQAITKRQLDDSKFAYETALKQVQNSGNDLSTAESRLAVMQAGITKAEAVIGVKQARINDIKQKLTYTNIYAPQTGKIGKKNIKRE